MKNTMRKTLLVLICLPGLPAWATPVQPPAAHDDGLTLVRPGMTMQISTPHSKPNTLNPLRSDVNSEALGTGSVESPETKRTEAEPKYRSSKPVTPNITVQNNVRTGSKELYLTFDDGPLEGTGNVLRVLKEEGVPATMFCVGRHAQQHPGLLRKELSMPNLLVANHTYSHANGHYRRFYSNTFRLMSDIEHAQLLLGGRKYLRLAGRNVWRTPEINRDDLAIVALRGRVEVPEYDALSKEGFHIYGWDTEWHYSHTSGKPVESPEHVADKIEQLYRQHRLAKAGKVVLLAHDFMFRSPANASRLRRFIRLMKQRGWSFHTIRHYSSYRPEPLYVAKYYGHSPKDLYASNKVSNQSTQAGRAEKSLHSSSSPSFAEMDHARSNVQITSNQTQHEQQSSRTPHLADSSSATHADPLKLLRTR